MQIWQIVLLIFIVLFVLTVVVIIVFKMLRHTYTEIINVRNVEELRKHFVLDNPNQDGTDPTGGMVDYSFMFPRDSQGKLIPNVNGDVSWQEIPSNASLIEDYDNGFYIGLDKEIKNKVVGAPRLMSRKLFRGGLFIFDVEHSPTGCAVWPALWLNGFVGGPDQYHEKIGTDKYNECIRKLADSTISKEGYDRTCSSPLVPNAKLDPHLSKYAGKNIFPSMWPVGGEFDILEQTNFSDTNLVSIHGGPLCEVVNGYDNNYMVQDKDINPDYISANVRSVCGATFWPDPSNPKSGVGPYSGCPDNVHKIGEQGGDSTELPNGALRYNCPQQSATNAGNSQVIAPFGSFGPVFNMNGGGVYAVQWTPKDIVNVWWFPRRLYSEKLLKSSGGPLADIPTPENWFPEMYPNKPNSPGENKPQKVLVASYILNNKDALTAGCDFNYQGIIINITLGGGWGGSNMPQYCSVNNKSEWTDYVSKCYTASPERAIKQEKGVDPENGCFDGGLSANYRGSHASPVFYKEAYFKIRQIRVLQRDGDDNVW